VPVGVWLVLVLVLVWICGLCHEKGGTRKGFAVSGQRVFTSHTGTHLCSLTHQPKYNQLWVLYLLYFFTPHDPMTEQFDGQRRLLSLLHPLPSRGACSPPPPNTHTHTHTHTASATTQEDCGSQHRSSTNISMRRPLTHGIGILAGTCLMRLD
jgi:hypothetical protein